MQTCVTRIGIFYMGQERGMGRTMSLPRADRKSHLVNGRMSIILVWGAMSAYTMTSQIAVCIERDVRTRIVAFRVPMSTFSPQRQNSWI